MGLGISKRYCLYSFHPMSENLYEDIGYHGGIQAITFLGNRPSFFFKLWHFESLTWESIGKPKMENNLKTSDRRSKQTKSWDSGYYIAHVRVGYF